jgi:type VI secretion system secreted protein VgrG
MRNNQVEVRIDSPDFPCERIRVREVAGVERLSRLFTFDVTLVSLDPGGPGATDLIGCAVALTFSEHGADVRRVFGMIAHAVDMLETESEQCTYRIRVVPRAYRLALVRTQDIYVDMSVVDIVKKKLALAGLEHSTHFRLLGGADKRYPKREFVIQYQETDLDFVSRLCEHVGISFHFTHHPERGDQIVFTDHNDAFPAHDADVERDAPPGASAPKGIARFSTRGDTTEINRLELAAEVIPALYSVSDYNYEKPLVDLSRWTEVPEGFGGGIMEYGSNVKDPEESAMIAKVRAEEHVARSAVFRGEADLSTLTAGTTFRLIGHPRVPERELVVIEAEHRLKSVVFEGGSGGESSYANVFRAIPVEAPYRPPRITPRPTISGVVHGIVEGDPGAQSDRPWIDAKGRYIVRVLFDTAERGERARPSLPIRMAQSHSGPNYGIHFPLRPATEVLLIFTGGDPDRPMIVGSVPNAVTPTPVVDRIATYHRIRTASGVMIEIDDGR